MKKVIFLLFSIISFFISIFFLGGVIVFFNQNDYEGTILFAIPLITFIFIFLLCFKKYIKLINLNLKSIFIKWKDSIIFRVVDMILSYFFFTMFLSAICNNSELTVPCMIATLFFSSLYIIKSIIGKKINISNFKNNILCITIGIILLILISIFYLYFNNFFGMWDILHILSEIFTSANDFMIIYYFLRAFCSTIVVGILPSVAYISLVMLIENSLIPTNTKSNIITSLNIANLIAYCLLFVLYFKEMITYINLLFISIFILIILILNIFLNIFMKNRTLNS